MTFPEKFITFVRSEKQYIIMRHDPSKRISPRHISALRDNEIFVFGSNLQGQHGGGAALALPSRHVQWPAGTRPG